MAELMPDGDLPRVPGWRQDDYEKLTEHYGTLSLDGCSDPGDLVQKMTTDLLAGAVNWRSPELQYNLGAAVNVVSGVMYAMGIDVNVYLINDGLAGNAIVAENAVGRIMASLTGNDPSLVQGVFTFGGTGTMAYAIKCGIRKVSPTSARMGLPANTYVVVTEDAHFSHATAADWLGIGSDQLLTIPVSAERRSDLTAAERLMREVLDGGNHIATIIVNGGTTYDHTVDDIPGFVALRDRLVRDYNLSYSPHLHVDSVVGWVWLMFGGYGFDVNPLAIAPAASDLIHRQYERIRWLRIADSWGVDFHKGVGGCPVDCSFIQFNDCRDCMRIAKGGSRATDLHQLAPDFSRLSPVDYTFETSRSGAKALAALAALQSLGQTGYQRVLAGLMESSLRFRDLLAQMPDMAAINPHALGYQTMVRLMPPGSPMQRAHMEMTQTGPDAARMVDEGNRYLKAFFSWDDATRMSINHGGVVYSFSGKYVTTPSGKAISGLKFYPTSPRIRPEHMNDAIALLARRKVEFDAAWKP
jgi:L-2,4-diaminobutyrate decarboxylase